MFGFEFDASWVNDGQFTVGAFIEDPVVCVGIGNPYPLLKQSPAVRSIMIRRCRSTWKSRGDCNHSLPDGPRTSSRIKARPSAVSETISGVWIIGCRALSDDA